MGKGNNSIAKSTGIMTAATLLSRITGLGRTWAMAFALGNTLVTSAYQVAYNMPSVIYDLVAGGKIRYIGCSNFSGWHADEVAFRVRTARLEPLCGTSGILLAAESRL